MAHLVERGEQTMTRIFLALTATVLILPAAVVDDTEKDESRKKAQALFDGGEWKKAAKAFKVYLKKHAASDEEKEEIRGLLRRSEGEEAWSKISGKYQKDRRLRSAVSGIRRFLEEYGDILELWERATEFREGLRSQYVGIVCDFEDADWPEMEDVKSLEPVDDLEMIKHGDQAARWKTGLARERLFLEPPTRDWSGYTYFCFWIWSARKTHRPGYLTFQAVTSPGHLFQRIYCVDFEGWREVRIPFSGKDGFGKMGMADWKSIEEFSIVHQASAAIPLDIILDDIRLEKHVK
jgi:hypothetical protein